MLGFSGALLLAGCGEATPPARIDRAALFRDALASLGDAPPRGRLTLHVEPGRYPFRERALRAAAGRVSLTIVNPTAVWHDVMVADTLAVVAGLTVLAVVAVTLALAGDTRDQRDVDALNITALNITLTEQGARGRELFARTCGQCHTLPAAGARGQVGRTSASWRRGAFRRSTCCAPSTRAC